MCIALPETTSYPPDIIHVYHGERAALTCPYVLGNLHKYLDPYEIFWDMCDEGSIPRISTQLSQENRVLGIEVTEPVDTAMYQCSLKIKLTLTKYIEGYHRTPKGGIPSIGHLSMT